jgi:hypothetical protein
MAGRPQGRWPIRGVARLAGGRTVLDAARRRAAMATDATVVRATRRLRRRDGTTARPGSLAVVTVNFSTSRWLKMMLLTLAEQDGLARVTRLVIVDNASRDGGIDFLRELAAHAPRVDLLERRRWLHHGPALRAGLRRLDELADASEAALIIDPDVLLLDPTTLDVVGQQIERGAHLVGERRHRGGRGPNIQASFLAVRRDAIRRRDVSPPLHDGAPTQEMQRDIENAGLAVADVPFHSGGLILHRGRSAVAAAAQYRPRHAYASARRRSPHYMGMPGGAATWADRESSYHALLDPAAEHDLVHYLATAFHQASAAPRA